jgi:hypothetical protein
MKHRCHLLTEFNRRFRSSGQEFFILFLASLETQFGGIVDVAYGLLLAIELQHLRIRSVIAQISNEDEQTFQTTGTKISMSLIILL